MFAAIGTGKLSSTSHHVLLVSGGIENLKNFVNRLSTLDISSNLKIKPDEEGGNGYL